MSSLIRTLTPGQRDELISLVDQCAALGATPDSLAPLLAVIYSAPDICIPEPCGHVLDLPGEVPFYD